MRSHEPAATGHRNATGHRDVATTVSRLPNLITGIRLASIPVLWGFALAGRGGVVGGGILFGWVTDALDGFLARRLHARSPWGSRFDSVTDTLLFVSAAGWVAVLRPGFVREHALLLGIWAGVAAAAYLVGWVRFRRFADVHLYSAKAANFLALFFAAHLVAFESRPDFAFAVVYAVCLLASLEMLLVFATFRSVDEDVGTVLRPGGRRPCP